MKLEKKEAKFDDLPTETKAALAPVLKALEGLKGAIDTKADSKDVIDKESLAKHVAAFDEFRTKTNDFIAELNKKAAEGNRSGGGGGNADARDEAKAVLANYFADERKAFDDYIRLKGVQGERSMDEIQRKAENDPQIAEAAKTLGLDVKNLSTVVAADGGFMVRPEYEAEMDEILLETSPMRQVANVREIGTGELVLPVNRKGTSVSWIAEKGTRTETNTAQISQEKFFAHELYAYPTATKQMLEDGLFDVEGWLHGEVVEALMIEENLRFVTGDGNGKPRGFIHSSVGKVAAASYDANTNWGSVAFVGTGSSGAFATGGGGADCLFNAFYSLKRAYRNNLDWLMSRLTLAEVRKIKDGQGNYLVRDAVTQNGLVPLLLGYPVQEMEDMPDPGANTYSIALGDWSKAYQIVDRIGMTVMRDELTQPGFVKFHFRKRVGGDVRNYDAYKLVKFA